MKRIIAIFINVCLILQLLTVAVGANDSYLKETADNTQVMQQGNSNPLQDLEVNRQGDIGSGVTYLCSREVIGNSSEEKFKMYSPQHVIDNNKDTYYSSGLYYNQESPENDYVQIEFPETQRIYQVNLISLPGGVSFPRDVEIQISTNGTTWTKAAQKTGMNVTSQKTTEIIFSAERSAKYVRVLSKKLKAQGDGTSYYAQYAGIQVLNSSDENVALLSKGAKASAPNSLYGDVFDYETFYADTIDTGVNWVNITNEFAYSDYKKSISVEPKETEIANFKKLKDNNINILYRFTDAPSLSEIQEDKDAAAERFINAMLPRVKALKDYVDVWGIFGEINVCDNKYAADYAYVIKKVISAIKEIDTTAKFNVATALIDYGWTKEILSAGLADCIDIIGIHIYKDIWPTLSYPEITGNVIKDGREISDTEHADYEAQIKEYKNLVASYSPDIKVMVTEVSEPEGMLPDVDGDNIVLAKWLTRQYTMDKLLGLDGTFWFTIDPISAPRIVTTLVNNKGERTPAWYALQNYNTVFSGTNSESLRTLDITGQTDKLKYGVYQNDTEYIIPYWYAVNFQDDFENGLINIDLSDFDTSDVTAVDLLTGKTQKVNIENGFAKNLIVKDYVTVLKVKKKQQTGEVWNEISETGGLGIGWNGHDERTQMTFSNDYTSDGNGSAKVEWSGSADEGYDAQIGIASSKIPAKTGAAVKAITMDVYVPRTVNGADNGAIESSLAGYVITTDDKHINGDEHEERKLSVGWNKITFDAVNGAEMPFFIWENKSKSGTIYIDNMRIEYQYPNEVFDSFENYSDDWESPDFTLSQNTDMAYVKDGQGSMKIECPTEKDAYGFRSKLLYVNGVNGKQIPKFEGCTPKKFGFWVYSDGAVASFKPEGTEDWRSIDSVGWKYLEWNIPTEATDWWDWNIDHFNQMVLKVTTPGNLYVDAMKIEYDGLKISDFSIKNASNNTNINVGDTVTVSTSIDKYDNSSYPFAMLVVLFDKDDNVVDVNIKQFKIGENETGNFIENVSVNVKDSKAVKARGFLWNDVERISPYVDSVTLSN